MLLLVFLVLASGSVQAASSPAVKKKLAAPKVTGSAEGRNVTVSWTNVIGAQQYELYLLNTSDNKYHCIRKVKSSEPRKVTLQGGVNKSYYYKVVAVRWIGGNKEYGTVSSIVRVKTVADPVPEFKKAQVVAGGVYLEWTKNVCTDGYRIFRSTKPSTGYSVLANVAGGQNCSYTDKTVKNGTTYYYISRSWRKNVGSNVYSGYSKYTSVKYVAPDRKAVFVGDSRTAMFNSFGLKHENFTFIGKVSMGYSWLANTAGPQAEKLLDGNTDIWLWMGVNDPDNINRYITYYNTMIPKWKAKGANVYMVAVGPITGETDGYVTRIQIEAFNAKLKAQVRNAVYLDLYTYLKNTGFKTTDKTHYDYTTQKKIFDWIIACYNKIK